MGQVESPPLERLLIQAFFYLAFDPAPSLIFMDRANSRPPQQSVFQQACQCQEDARASSSNPNSRVNFYPLEAKRPKTSSTVFTSASSVASAAI
jgi:hypothetical protein